MERPIRYEFSGTQRPEQRRDSYNPDRRRSSYGSDPRRGSYNPDRRRSSYGSDPRRRPANPDYRRRPGSYPPRGGSYHPSGRRPVRRRRRRSPFRVLVSFLLIVLLLCLVGFGGYALIFSRLGAVENVRIAKATDTSVTLNWDEMGKANGYRIYSRERGENEYKKIAELQDKKTVAHTIDGLHQASEYSFYVTGFNNYSESGDFTAVDNVFTKPQALELKKVKSDREGEITVAWEQNEKADGYCVQYRTAGSKEYTEEVLIKDNKDCSLEITELSENGTYDIRVRAYVDRNTRLFSEWSEQKDITSYKSKNNGVSGPPMIALTFDDGPGGKPSDEILDVLEANGAKATFFMVGSNAKSYPENVRRKAELGMELGNHTFDHSHYGDDVTASDIQDASNAIQEVAGKYPTAFRSPGGMTTDTIREECANEQMALYYWSVDTEDWNSRDEDAVYHQVMDNVQDGDIVLMHEIYDSTAKAVERMVPELIERGFQLVTCEQLVEAKSGSKPEAGVEYVTGDMTM